MKRKKSRLSLFLLGIAGAAFVLGCLGSASVLDSGYRPGVYEGSGQGYRGPIHVRVQVSGAGIEDIVIVSHGEWAFGGGSAMEELLEQVLESGSTELDVISGATFSSRGFLEAVEEALDRAAAH
jgi:fumarate reductase flavoprotein subunit